MSIIGENMKALREARGMSISAVSIPVGTSQDFIRAYESGEKIPDKETLEKIADAFSVSIDFLLSSHGTYELPVYSEVKHKKSDRRGRYNKNYDYTIHNIVCFGKRFSEETYKVYECYKEYILNLPTERRTEEHNSYLAMVEQLVSEAKPKRKRGPVTQ